MKSLTKSDTYDLVLRWQDTIKALYSKDGRPMQSRTPRINPPPTTGLILAGGEGRRMGGQDKGLIELAGRPLVAHVLDCLQPQVNQVMISANRHADTYAAFGWPVITDRRSGFHGPLAGIEAGLQHCATDWLLVVPCDVPALPANLASRLHAALARNPDARIASVHTEQRSHPSVSLIHRSTLPALHTALDAGERRLRDWLASQSMVSVLFAGEEPAFANLNDRTALQEWVLAQGVDQGE